MRVFGAYILFFTLCLPWCARAGTVEAAAEAGETAEGLQGDLNKANKDAKEAREEADSDPENQGAQQKAEGLEEMARLLDAQMQNVQEAMKSVDTSVQERGTTSGEQPAAEPGKEGALNLGMDEDAPFGVKLDDIKALPVDDAKPGGGGDAPKSPEIADTKEAAGDLAKNLDSMPSVKDLLPNGGDIRDPKVADKLMENGYNPSDPKVADQVNAINAANEPPAPIDSMPSVKDLLPNGGDIRDPKVADKLMENGYDPADPKVADQVNAINAAQQPETSLNPAPVQASAGPDSNSITNALQSLGKSLGDTLANTGNSLMDAVKSAAGGMYDPNDMGNPFSGSYDGPNGDAWMTPAESAPSPLTPSSLANPGAGTKPVNLEGGPYHGTPSGAPNPNNPQGSYTTANGSNIFNTGYFDSKTGLPLYQSTDNRVGPLNDQGMWFPPGTANSLTAAQIREMGNSLNPGGDNIHGLFSAAYPGGAPAAPVSAPAPWSPGKPMSPAPPALVRNSNGTFNNVGRGGAPAGPPMFGPSNAGFTNPFGGGGGRSGGC